MTHNQGQLTGLLLPQSQNQLIGVETGVFHRDGTSILFRATNGQGTDRKGSYRFVWSAEGRILAGLQVMFDGETPLLANVYVDPVHRRLGHAGDLLREAEAHFGREIDVSDHVTADGQAWVAAMRARAARPGP